jgi:hypothetical protein
LRSFNLCELKMVLAWPYNLATPSVLQ